MTVLGTETTEVSRDAQNKEEGPRLSAFYLNARFAAKMKRLVTSEAKMSKQRFWASKNTFCNGKIQKLCLSFFFTPNPCYSREELAGSALACARGRPGNTPVLAKNHCDLAPALPGRFRARQK